MAVEWVIHRAMKLCRKDMGLSVREMAYHLGTSSANISRIENNKGISGKMQLRLITWLFDKSINHVWSTTHK